ncbi:MAG: PCMD domain-containing protein [Bacteroidota bacterium]
MKKYFALLSLLFCIQFSNAQNAIPNPGFETWNPNPNYDDPASWGTINGLTYFLGVRTVTKTTDKHNGSFAMKLESKAVILQGTAPGIAATGTINTGGFIEGGVVYTRRPISMTGWYKYTPSGADTASIEATLSKWNTNTQTRDEVGKAVFTQNQTVGTYTQFNVNFTYSSALTPDTLVMILLTSSQGNTSPVGSILFVDDLAFELCTGFSASAASTNSTCTASDGSVTASVTAGTGSLTYAWSGGGATATVSKPAGTYTVTASDANACSVTASTTVTANTVTLNAAATTAPATCTAADGSASVTVSLGTSPYTYLWSNTATSNSITAVAGNYNVTATDINGCSASTAATISANTTLLNVATTSTQSSCTVNTGTASASTADGTQPYSFLWSTTGTADSITSVGAGNYTVTITDANGCSGSTAVAVTTPTGPSATEVHSDVLCNGANTGSIDVAVVGGTGPLSYLWNDAVTTEDRTSLPAGNYCVTITDVNNCVFQQCVTVVEPTALILSETHINVLCNGANTGSIDITASGGTSPYIVSWSGSGSINLAAGTYTVTITDANSCSVSSSYSVSEPAMLVASSTVVDASSQSAADGSITVNSSGGTTPYAINWSSGNGVSLSTGSYCFTVTDANNCTTSGCDTVSAPTAIGNIFSDAIKLYPNPASSNIVIETNSSADKFSFSVFNLEGRLVEEMKISGDKVTVDVKYLAVGLYTYQLRNISTDKVNYGKLQIEK